MKDVEELGVGHSSNGGSRVAVAVFMVVEVRGWRLFVWFPVLVECVVAATLAERVIGWLDWPDGSFDSAQFKKLQ